MDANPEKLASGGFENFLAIKVPNAKNTITNVLDVFNNAMKLFQNDVGKKKRSVQLQNLNRLERGIGRIQNTIFRNDPVSASKSAPCVASSWLAVELVVTSVVKGFSMRPMRDKRAKQRPSRKQTLSFDSGAAV